MCKKHTKAVVWFGLFPICFYRIYFCFRIHTVKRVHTQHEFSKNNPRSLHTIVSVTPKCRSADLLKYIPRINTIQNSKKMRPITKENYIKTKTLFKKSIGNFLVLILLCGFGGLMFKFTEGSFETYYKCGVKRVKRDFIDTLWTKSHNLREEDWKHLARTKLRVFEEEIYRAHEAGMVEYSGYRSWSFLNGVVYSLSLISTIGRVYMISCKSIFFIFKYNT